MKEPVPSHKTLDSFHLGHSTVYNALANERGYKWYIIYKTAELPEIILFLLLALENKIHQFEEKRQQMKEEIELLQDLKQTLCSVQENRDLSSSSTSVSSLSS